MGLFTRKQDTFDASIPRQCATCGHSFNGRYCNLCGEKVVELNERTLRYFLGHVLNAFTFIDGKFWRSFKTMVTRPGGMAKEICDGKRQPYMRPISFFFVANVIYFLFPLFQTFTAPLNAQVYYMSYSRALGFEELVHERIEKEGTSYEEFQARYNPHSEYVSKLTLVLLPLIFSLFVSLIFIRRKLLYVDTLTFSLEFMSFALFIVTILLSLFLISLVWIGQLVSFNAEWLVDDQFLAPLSLVLSAVFLFFAVRNFFRLSVVWSVVGAIALTHATLATIEIYRIILFYITLATV